MIGKKLIAIQFGSPPGEMTSYIRVGKLLAADQAGGEPSGGEMTSYIRVGKLLAADQFGLEHGSMTSTVPIGKQFSAEQIGQTGGTMDVEIRVGKALVADQAGGMLPVEIVASSYDTPGDENLSLALPSGAQEGDALWAWVVSETGATDPTPPSGWTQTATTVSDGNIKLTSWLHVVGSGDTGPYAFTGAAGQVLYGACLCLRYDGAAVAYSDAGGNSTTISPGGVTATADGQVMFFAAAAGDFSGATLTGPFTVYLTVFGSLSLLKLATLAVDSGHNESPRWDSLPSGSWAASVIVAGF